MNVAFNPGINYGTMYRPNINKPIRKMEAPTSLPQTSYYKDPIPSVFHSKEDCGVGETYLNCALSGSEGDPNNLPCNFYKSADYHAYFNASDSTNSHLDKVNIVSAIREFMEAGFNQGYYNQYVDFLALLNAIERNSY